MNNANYVGSCWSEPARPCPDLIAKLTDGVGGNGASAAAAGSDELIAHLRRETLDRPAIFIGTGTCGLGAGARATQKAVQDYLEKTGTDADIVEVGCIGLCAAEPILDVQLPGKARVSFSNVTADKVQSVLEAALKGVVPETASVLGKLPIPGCDGWDNVGALSEHPFFAPQTRWVLENCGLINPARIEEYIARGGYRALANTFKNHRPDEVCDMVEASGLRGRGGGGFLTGRKWKFATATPSENRYLICNADEGDPGAFMDRAVIEGDPHRLLEGMAIAAYALGATRAYIYIRAEYPLAIRRLEDAIKQAKSYGLLGHNILDSGIDFEIVIKKGAGAFVCGEETALIHSIEGKRGMPRPRPPFPAVQGLFGKPTIINNVETLSNIPGIFARGVDKFAAMGTEGSKGTKVFALSGRVNRTGLVEVKMGTNIRQIVMEIGGGIPGGKKFKAVQIGGPSGGCLPEDHLDIQVDYEAICEAGAMMGSGGLVVMDETTCMVDLAKFFMDFIQRESCGKCIPCREGTRRMLEVLETMTRPRREESGDDALHRFHGIMYLERLAEVIRETSLCGLGQTAPNPVLSTLRWFRDEYEAHIYERKCPAGACTSLRTYQIDAEKCKGCTLCTKHCPTEAIMGARRSPHYIIPDKCIGCGTCAEVCRLGAVVIG